jgi:hypothetical protein
MRSNPLLSETPGRRPFYLVANGFQLPVVCRYSPLFTAVLVHIWYMEIERNQPEEVSANHPSYESSGFTVGGSPSVPKLSDSTRPR